VTKTTRNFAAEIRRWFDGYPPVGGRPRSRPDELVPAILDLALDRCPFRRSLSWIADRLLETKYKGQNKSKKKLERRIAETLDHIGWILKKRHPTEGDPRSLRDRAFDYLESRAFDKHKPPPKTLLGAG
jgi:hypothetical protein